MAASTTAMQEIGVCFRTDSEADDFAKIHSIAETAMKNGNPKYQAILDVIQQLGISVTIQYP